MWKVKIVEVATELIGNFGSVSKNIDSDIQNFEIKCPIEFLWKACLLWTARIIREVLRKN